MTTFVITIIYYKSDPHCYEVVANTRSEAVRLAWTKYDQVKDFIKKISVVMK